MLLISQEELTSLIAGSSATMRGSFELMITANHEFAYLIWISSEDPQAPTATGPESWQLPVFLRAIRDHSISDSISTADHASALVLSLTFTQELHMIQRSFYDRSLFHEQLWNITFKLPISLNLNHRLEPKF